jgi:hypothetical protein
MKKKNIFRRFIDYAIRPMPESRCGDCGETYGHFGPDGPRHKCSVKAQVKMALREIEEEKRNETNI